MVNQTVIQGRLTAYPELRQTQNGTPVCTFRVAWYEKIKDTENKLFIDCVTWRGTAEFVSRHFGKGDPIIVEGKLASRDWADKDGNKRSTIELTAERVHFCGSKRDREEETVSVPSDVKASDFADLDGDDGDLPF